MAWLRYYGEERARHPDIEAMECDRFKASRVIERYSREFGVTQPALLWNPEKSLQTSWYRPLFHRIYINFKPTLRTVVHELAHAIHWKQGKKPGERWHGARHRSIVDAICQSIREDVTRTPVINRTFIIEPAGPTLKAACPQDNVKECPKCHKKGAIDLMFGYRAMNGVKRPQSYCRECR